MIPVGYMAKFRTPRPEWVKAQSYRVTDLSLLADLYSVSDCVQNRFEHFIDDWQDGEVEPKNDYRLYDSPDMIRQLADRHGVDLTGRQLFFYEVYEQEYDEDDAQWYSFEPSFQTQGVVAPSMKTLEGYDVLSSGGWPNPGCSCWCIVNMADETDEHWLLPSLERARRLLGDGQFDNSEPGPFRIFAVYSVGWR